MPKLITLNQKLRKLKINKAEIENEVVFTYFNNLPAKKRDNKFFQALRQQ